MTRAYIEGTVDFIFGRGKSIYLNTQLHMLQDNGMTVITAQARDSPAEDVGYSFVHCQVTGIGNMTYLVLEWFFPTPPWARSSIALDGLITSNLNASRVFTLQNTSVLDLEQIKLGVLNTQRRSQTHKSNPSLPLVIFKALNGSFLLHVSKFIQ
ncbi:hypothetical protein LWI29_002871 [Acer saccharum]|uniref:Pectinesterase n=1 Tax=Acer saccharum TaxID=4024 RepID=A0AA39SW36_ACESA|nr:hypothetical protein LWI29_002871 [Acer saccharum]